MRSNSNVSASSTPRASAWDANHRAAFAFATSSGTTARI